MGTSSPARWHSKTQQELTTPRLTQAFSTVRVQKPRVSFVWGPSMEGPDWAVMRSFSYCTKLILRIWISKALLGQASRKSWSEWVWAVLLWRGLGPNSQLTAIVAPRYSDREVSLTSSFPSPPNSHMIICLSDLTLQNQLRALRDSHSSSSSPHIPAEGKEEDAQLTHSQQVETCCKTLVQCHPTPISSPRQLWRNGNLAHVISENIDLRIAHCHGLTWLSCTEFWDCTIL